MSDPETNMDQWQVVPLGMQVPAIERDPNNLESIYVPDVRPQDWVRINDLENMRKMVEDCGIVSPKTLEELSTQRFRVHSVIANRQKDNSIHYMVS